jgi:hypothetical protein
MAFALIFRHPPDKHVNAKYRHLQSPRGEEVMKASQLVTFINNHDLFQSPRGEEVMKAA